VGDAHDTGFFSAGKRPICLQRAKRVTNCVEDVCFAVLYADANGWYKSDKKYLYAVPSLVAGLRCIPYVSHRYSKCSLDSLPLL
jgi:hypothetical protein